MALNGFPLTHRYPDGGLDDLEPLRGFAWMRERGTATYTGIDLPGTHRLDAARPGQPRPLRRLLAELAARFDTLRPFLVERSTVDAPVRIRTLDSYIDTPVADAFDLVAGVPTSTPLPPDER